MRRVHAHVCLKALKTSFLTKPLCKKTGAKGTTVYSRQKVRMEQTMLQNGLVEKLIFKCICCRCIYFYHAVPKNIDIVSGTGEKGLQCFPGKWDRYQVRRISKPTIL